MQITFIGLSALTTLTDNRNRGYIKYNMSKL